MFRTFVLTTACWSVAAVAGAQTATATLNASLNPVARLSLSTNSLSFPDGDPDIFPVLTASPASVLITARARASYGSTITLTVQASDDLRSGVTTIPADAVTWTASGPGFVGGTVSRSSAQPVASWSASGVYNGSQSFAFRNQWSYPTGTYTLTLLYTLSAP